MTRSPAAVPSGHRLHAGRHRHRDAIASAPEIGRLRMRARCPCPFGLSPWDAVFLPGPLFATGRFTTRPAGGKEVTTLTARPGGTEGSAADERGAEVPRRRPSEAAVCGALERSRQGGTRWQPPRLTFPPALSILKEIGYVFPLLWSPHAIAPGTVPAAFGTASPSRPPLPSFPRFDATPTGRTRTRQRGTEATLGKEERP